MDQEPERRVVNPHAVADKAQAVLNELPELAYSLKSLMVMMQDHKYDPVRIIDIELISQYVSFQLALLGEVIESAGFLLKEAHLRLTPEQLDFAHAYMDKAGIMHPDVYDAFKALRRAAFIVTKQNAEVAAEADQERRN